MMMHDCRHESNEIGGRSDAESSRVDAKKSTAVGDAPELSCAHRDVSGERQLIDISG